MAKVITRALFHQAVFVSGGNLGTASPPVNYPHKVSMETSDLGLLLTVTKASGQATTALVPWANVIVAELAADEKKKKTE